MDEQSHNNNYYINKSNARAKMDILVTISDSGKAKSFDQFSSSGSVPANDAEEIHIVKSSST